MSYHLIVEYSVNSIFKEDFINAWNDPIQHYQSTDLMIKSELIQSNQRIFVEHAHWKNREAFKKSLTFPSQKSSNLNAQLESLCDSIQLKYAGHPVKQK